MKQYTIYKITQPNQPSYIGMTLQPLATRLAQHKTDAKNGTCSVSNRLCKKKKPTDLAAFYSRLKTNTAGVKITALATMTSDYMTAHRQELAMKRSAR